jgi:DNA polymerase-3 subunit beta
MKLSVPQKDLARALSVVKTVAKGSTLPILSNVALRAERGALHLHCSDLDMHLQSRLDATVSEPGACTVSASTFSNLVSSFAGSESVDLQLIQGELKVVSGQTSKYKLGILPIEDMVPLPEMKGAVEFELPQGTLHDLLARTSFCSSDDESRYVLKSSFLSLNGHLACTATDGRRLATEEAEISTKVPAISVLLPTNAVAELLKLLAGDADKDTLPPTKIAFADTMARFTVGDCILTSKLIEGQYPNYKQVIPETPGDGLPVGRTDLLVALKRVAILADTCILDFAGQMLTIRARGAKDANSEAIETLLVPKCKTIKAMFNVHYLIDVLEAVADDEVLLHLTEENCPLVLKLRNRQWTCVTMPMRLDEATPTPEK